MTKYKVLVGCNFPPKDTRAEVGEVIDVSEDIGKALARIGAVAGLTSTKPPKSNNKTGDAPEDPHQTAGG